MRTRLFTLFASLLCSTVMLAYDFYSQGLCYNLNAENKTAEVTYLNNEGGYGYNYGRNISSADIPETVTKDGVTYTVTSIGDHAFRACGKLTSVTIPNTVTSIGCYAFESCEKLAEVTIPNSVVTIGDYAFKDCYGVDTATEPGTTLNTGLTTVNIGSGVTSIGVRAFYSCSNLTAINVSTQNLNFSSPDGVLMNKYKKILITYPSGKEGRYNIPTTVTTIKAWAFHGGGLTGISIPNTVTVIEDHAFDNCYGLQRDADGMRYADTYLIEGSANATSCTVKDGTRWIGYHAFSGCNKLTSVSIPNSVTAIGSFAFRNCTSLSRLYIPETVANINSLAFQNVPVIEYYGTATGGPWGAKKWIGQTKEVYTEFDRSTEPRTLTYYYDNRRESRSGVTEVYDPNVIRFVGYDTAIQKVVIDPSMKDAPLTTMERLFFGGFDSEAGINSALFYVTAIEGLENLNTANVTNMNQMFMSCYNLKSLDLSSFNTSNVTRMEFMFYNCGSLQTLDLNSFDISKLQSTYCMFRQCESLQTIYCNANWSTSTLLTSSTDMFSGCDNLVGGSGTPYGINDVDYTFARPDGGPDAPGYFTSRTSQVYTVFDGDHTLTYYYDDKYDLTNPYCEFYDPVNEPWKLRFSTYNDQITEVVIDPSMANANLTSLNCFFSGSGNSLIYLATIKGMENLNTANVEDMSAMFLCCYGLKTIDLTMLNTKKLTNASQMFAHCGILTTIYCNEDLTTQLVKSEDMFLDCPNLIGGWGTPFSASKTDGASARPDGASASGYFTKILSQMYTEFDEATGTLTYRYDDLRLRRNGVTELCEDTPRFVQYSEKVVKAVIDPSMKEAPVTSLNRLFFGGYSSDKGEDVTLSKLTTIEGLENLNTSVVVNMNEMFKGCSSLKVLDLTSFNISSLVSATGMFNGCKSLATIFCDDDWSKRTELEISDGMFVYCDNLVGGKGTKFNGDPWELTDKRYARPDGGTSDPGYFTKKDAMVYTVFDKATGTLTYRYDDQYDVSSPYVEIYDPVNHPSAVRFTGYDGKVLKAVIDPSMKNANLTSLNSMFFGGVGATGISALSKMKSIEGLENLNTANVTDMANMFLGCNAIESLDVSTFDISKVTDMTFMFNSCYALMTIFCSKDWSVSPTLTTDLGMFSASKILVGGHGTDYDASKVDRSYARPDRGETNPGYFTIKGDANGDNKVSITDAVGIVNCILGNPSSDFSKGAANLNGDLDENGEPNITITDAVGVVNIILNSSGDTPAPAMATPVVEAPEVGEPE